MRPKEKKLRPSTPRGICDHDTFWSSRSAHTIVLNIDEKCGDQPAINFDSDSTTVVCNNSANIHICNDKQHFVDELRPVAQHKVATIGGRGHAPSGIGTVEWTWCDDKGKRHTYRVRNVLFFPQSPINILSVTEFAKQLNDEEGTGVDTKQKR